MSTPEPSKLLYRQKKTMRNLHSNNNQKRHESSIGNQFSKKY